MSRTPADPTTRAASRLDMVLVARGLAPTRARARDAILRGHVTVEGTAATKPAMTVPEGAAITVDDPAGRFVSRSALKLIAGLDAFGYSPEGRVALDLGASTGGFTEVLLERGADRVYAVDVGHDQLHHRLRDHARVHVREGINARDLRATHVGRPVDAIAADVSFISLKLALPAAFRLAAPGAWGIFLVKPQFEAGRGALGKGGVVRDAAVAQRAADDIAAWLADAMGWWVDGLIESPIAGGDGNREFLIGAVRG